jgi:hypothetical protein
LKEWPNETTQGIQNISLKMIHHANTHWPIFWNILLQPRRILNYNDYLDMLSSKIIVEYIFAMKVQV